MVRSSPFRTRRGRFPVWIGSVWILVAVGMVSNREVFELPSAETKVLGFKKEML
jgi:hypothetical protein